MNIIMTCRECGHQEMGRSENGLMNRIKMLNHVQREHYLLATTPSRVRMLMREDRTAEERYEEEAYNLESSY